MPGPELHTETRGRENHATSMSSMDPRLEVAATFLKLGLTSFGGPVAHIGYLRQMCVVRRQWLEESEFADLVSLCQFLPGPASSQLVFALGERRAGGVGGTIASFCFTLPSAVLMIAFAYGVSAAEPVSMQGWIHGLKLAAVPIVAQAVWGMGRSLCPDPLRRVIAGAAAILLLWLPHAALQISTIIAGAMAGWWWYRQTLPRVESAVTSTRHGAWLGAGLLGLAGVLLGLLPVASAMTGNKTVAVFDSIYRSGALVFGGGHVVLPLLRAELVPQGWIQDDAFLAGYGAAQALPGPLFTFAGYLGTLVHGSPHGWVGGLLGLFAIFLPGWLLIAGALPFWQTLRSQPWAQGALRGANAAVVGVLISAFCNPVWTEGIQSIPDAVLALLAVVGLVFVRLPSWAIVLLCALYGRILHHGTP